MISVRSLTVFCESVAFSTIMVIRRGRFCAQTFRMYANVEIAKCFTIGLTHAWGNLL